MLLRVTALISWAVLASLAIAGFAAFSPEGPETATTTTTTVEVRSDWGSVSGRVSAMAFAAGLDVAAASAEPAEYDPYQLAVAETIPTTTTTSTTTTTTTTTTTAPPKPRTTSPPATQPNTTSTTKAPPPPETTSTTSTTVPSSFRASVEQWRGLVEKHFRAEDVNLALSVIDCESGGNPNATNSRTGAGGLFQHLFKYWDARAEAAGWAGADVYDPEANIAVSAHLVYSSGWYHWGSCV